MLQNNYSVQCALMVASLVAKVALATSYDSATWSDAARQIHQTSKILEACSIPSTISLCSCMAFVCMVCASEINSLRTVCFVSHKHFKLQFQAKHSLGVQMHQIHYLLFLLGIRATNLRQRSAKELRNKSSKIKLNHNCKLLKVRPITSSKNLLLVFSLI